MHKRKRATTTIMPSLNRKYKSFALISLVAVIINIRLHNLFHGGIAAPDDSHDEFNYPRRSAEKESNSSAVAHKKVDGFEVGSCFRARNDTVSASRYGKLKPPYVNLGFPKIGSSSIHSFFACAGYRSMHYRCRPDAPCADCIAQSVVAGLPNPFGMCNVADSYSQIDTGSHGHFAQVEYLEEIVRGIPNGTFFLTFRSMEKWYRSMSNWPPDNKSWAHMVDGLRWADIKGFPAGRGRNRSEFDEWFCNHVDRVREVVARDPSRTLVEVDIEDPTMGSRMAEIFDVDEDCWGHRNFNARLHPGYEGNQTSNNFPWFVRGKSCVRGRTGMRKKRMEPLPQIPGRPQLNDTLVCN